MVDKGRLNLAYATGRKNYRMPRTSHLFALSYCLGQDLEMYKYYISGYWQGLWEYLENR